MKSSLYKGMEKQQKDDVVASFKSSSVFRKAAVNVLREKIESARKTARMDANYSSASWAYQQAGLIEKEKAYLEAISLLEE